MSIAFASLKRTVSLGLLAGCLAWSGGPSGSPNRIESAPGPAPGSGAEDGATRTPRPGSLSPSQMMAVRDAYGNLPLVFEPNRGQMDPKAKFVSRSSQGFSLFLTASGAVMTVTDLSSSARDVRGPARRAALRMEVVGGDSHARVHGQGELPGTVNYILGNDPARWLTGVPTYAEVRYEDVYPGVDLRYYGRQRALEYDFIVAPGSDPETISLRVEGADNISIDAGGDLVMQVAGMQIRQLRPQLYQEVDGVRREVAGGYRMTGRSEFGFDVHDYDRGQPLVIDPVVVYSTYLGGTLADGDTGEYVGIAVDATGSAYVTSVTASLDFPTTPGALAQTQQGGTHDAFVTKLDTTGTALVYSTYLGGNGRDYATSIAVNALGQAFITGGTNSTNFPTTAGAFDTTPNGDGPFVTRLDANGSALVYSTYLGVGGGYAIAVDNADSAYVTGSAMAGFPTTPGAFDTSLGGSTDAFVTKMNAAGSGLVYSTFLGGSTADKGDGIAVDGSGNAYVTGNTDSNDFPTTPSGFQTSFGGGTFDAFVTKLNPTGSAQVYSTYLGGDGSDNGRDLVVDGGGIAYVAGETASTDFPTTPGTDDSLGGTFDAFVTKIDAAGSTLEYSTYLGGSDVDGASGVVVNGSGEASVTGATMSADFPTTADAFDRTFNGGIDVFVTTLHDNGNSLVHSTFFGSAGNEIGSEIGLDTLGDIYLTGATSASDLPVTSGAYDTSFNGGMSDAFVTKLGLTSLPVVTAETVTPNSGAGLAQVFTATYTDTGGASNLKARIRFSVGNVAPGSCTVEYNVKARTVRIMDDAGVWGVSVPIGSGGTLSNSQCTLNPALSSAAENSINLTLTVHVTFSPTFAGLKDIFLWARHTGGAKTGWLPRGTWTAGVVVEAVSVTPDTGSGMSQLFNAVYTDTAGASDLKAMLRFGTGTVGTCEVQYNAATDLIRIRDDAGIWQANVPLGSGTLANSQCTVDLAQSSASETGATLTLSLHVSFNDTFIGLKNVAMKGKSALSPTAKTKMDVRGTWNVIPIVSVVATDPSASETGPDPGTFTFTRTGSFSQALNNVTFTRGGTASAASDYTNFSLSVSFPAGQQTATVTVTPVQDALVESDETVILTLTDGANYDLGTPSQATVTIADTVIPLVTVEATDPNAAEQGADPGTFTFTRSGNLSLALNTVAFTRAGTATAGSDYTSFTLSVNFPAGQATTTVTVTPLTDALVEGDETVILTLTDGPNYDLGAPSQATVTIADTVIPLVTVAATDPNAAEVGSDPGTFTFTRTGSLSLALNGVSFTRAGTATAGVDYSNFTLSVSFPAGQATTTVTVTPLTDALVEGDETVILTLTDGPNYDLGVPSQATVTIADTVVPFVSVEATDPNAAEPGSDPGTFTFTRTGSLSQALNGVTFTRAGTATAGVDYTSFTLSVSFPAGQATTTATVTPINDALVEGNETVILTLTDGANYDLGTPSQATVTIADNVVPLISVVATDPSAAEPGSDPGTFTFTRTGSLSLALNGVSFTRAGTATASSDYTSFTLSVNFPAGQATATATVTPIDDALVEGDETVILTLTDDVNYDVGAPSQATVTIADNVTPVITVAATDPTAAEPGSDPGVFTFTRTGSLSLALNTVTFTRAGSATASSDYTSFALSVNFPAGQATVTMTVTPINDALVEGDETVILTLTDGPNYDLGAPSQATVTIADNVVPLITVVATDPNAAEQGSDPGVFTLTRVGNLSLALNSVTFTRAGTAAAASDYTNFALSVNFPAGQATVTVTVTPIDDALVEGNETVILTLTDGPNYDLGAPSQATVTIADND